MAFTQAHLTALEEAYAAGATRVTYEGKTLQYDTLEALYTAIQRIRGELETAGGTQSERSSRVAISRR